jgi:LmbE family N-acetylglucosaminyl deacetylase
VAENENPAPEDLRPAPPEDEQAREIPRRVMVVAAHPDDAEVGCGATIAKWVREGATAFYLICTNGDKGSDEANVSSEELAAIRDREQRAAAAAIGVSDVVILPRRDGELVYSIELRGDIVRWIRTWKPDAVFTHDPTIIISANGFINHADHRATGTATVDAIYPFIRSPLQYPDQIADGLEPHIVHDIYLWGAAEPNFWVDVSDTIQCKVDALKCHASQFSDPERTGNFASERLKRAGAEHGVAYAETFRHINLRRR